MYRIDDRKSAVKEIQRYLMSLAAENFRIVPSGVFDVRTREAVTSFQRRNGILESGVVDYETFNALYENFVLVDEKKKAMVGVGKTVDFPLSEGVMNDSMIDITNTMKGLLKHYRINPTFRVSRYFGKEVSEAVRALRKIYRMESSEEIDELFYGRMIKDLKLIAYFSRHSV